MNCNIFEECETALEKEDVIARRRFVSPSATAVEMRIQPGGAIPAHSTGVALLRVLVVKML